MENENVVEECVVHMNSGDNGGVMDGSENKRQKLRVLLRLMAMRRELEPYQLSGQRT